MNERDVKMRRRRPCDHQHLRFVEGGMYLECADPDCPRRFFAGFKNSVNGIVDPDARNEMHLTADRTDRFYLPPVTPPK